MAQFTPECHTNFEAYLAYIFAATVEDGDKIEKEVVHEYAEMLQNAGRRANLVGTPDACIVCDEEVILTAPELMIGAEVVVVRSCGLEAARDGNGFSYGELKYHALSAVEASQYNRSALGLRSLFEAEEYEGGMHVGQEEMCAQVSQLALESEGKDSSDRLKFEQRFSAFEVANADRFVNVLVGGVREQVPPWKESLAELACLVSELSGMAVGSAASLVSGNVRFSSASLVMPRVYEVFFEAQQAVASEGVVSYSKWGVTLDVFMSLCLDRVRKAKWFVLSRQMDRRGRDVFQRSTCYRCGGVGRPGGRRGVRILDDMKRYGCNGDDSLVGDKRFTVSRRKRLEVVKKPGLGQVPPVGLEPFDYWNNGEGVKHLGVEADFSALSGSSCDANAKLLGESVLRMFGVGSTRDGGKVFGCSTNADSLATAAHVHELHRRKALEFMARQEFRI